MVNVIIYYKFGFTKKESHDLLKKAVQDLYDIPENELEVSIMDRGKPFFTFHPEVHFSISHTNDLWVCAISSDQIGCDVQYHKTAGRRNTETLYKIAQRYFSPEETLAVQKADNTEKIFYDIWSRKEASVKLTGEGISKGFKKHNTACLDNVVIKDFFLPEKDGDLSCSAAAFENFSISIKELSK